LLRLLDESDEQITWYHPGMRVPGSDGHKLARLKWREVAADEARATIAEAYEFLVDCWDRGDRIYMFGVGRGAIAPTPDPAARHRRRAARPDGLCAAAYAVPARRTRRTGARRCWRHDWPDTAKSVFPPVFGLWDMRGAGSARGANLDQRRRGQHAVAVDGRPLAVTGLVAGMR
jgi:hypothetical protein